MLPHYWFPPKGQISWIFQVLSSWSEETSKCFKVEAYYLRGICCLWIFLNMWHWAVPPPIGVLKCHTCCVLGLLFRTFLFPAPPFPPLPSPPSSPTSLLSHFTSTQRANVRVSHARKRHAHSPLPTLLTAHLFWKFHDDNLAIFLQAFWCQVNKNYAKKFSGFCFYEHIVYAELTELCRSNAYNVDFFAGVKNAYTVHCVECRTSPLLPPPCAILYKAIYC